MVSLGERRDTELGTMVVLRAEKALVLSLVIVVGGQIAGLGSLRCCIVSLQASL